MKEVNKHASMLMFDDDAEDALLVKTAIRRIEYPIQFVHLQTGTEFLAELEWIKQSPERMRQTLLLLDLNMPSKNGIEWLRELREQSAFNDLTIVVFSTSNMAEERARSRLLGADDHLGKPDSVNDLEKQLLRLYERWLKPAM